MQITGNEKHLKKINEFVRGMTELYEADLDNKYELHLPRINQPCAKIPKNENEGFYRGKIVNVYDNGEVEVIDVDYGDKERVPISSLRLLPQRFLTHPMLKVI